MRAAWVIAALALSLGTRAAWAQEQTEDPDKPGAEPAQGEDKDDDDDQPAFTHKGQVELHLQGVMGYRSIVTYDEEFCGDLKDNGENRSTCYGRSPFGFEVGLGYGVLSMLEVFLEMRLGVEH